MATTSLARIGAMLDPHYAAKLELIERHAQAHFLTTNALEAERHRNRLAELDRELDNRLTAMRAQHQLDSEKALADSIMRQMEERTAFRRDAARMILEAAIKVKIGKIEHERNLETIYLTKLYDYLFELCRTNQQQAAREYIDQLYAEGKAGGF